MRVQNSVQEPALLSVAPMMDWTDVHFRQLVRLLTKRTQLWTEMVVDKTIIHTDQPDRFLWFPPEQHPIVCQIGGSDPQELAAAAKKVAEYGYDEINVNCGCPSDRVAGAGCFGAALMLQPELVGKCLAAIAEAVDIEVTVKCRLGVDDQDSYADVCRFIHTVSTMSPVNHFIIHCRKCFLQGLNPHQNRTIPPLRYEWAFALKRDFPHLNFSLNGGILHPKQALQILQTQLKTNQQQNQFQNSQIQNGFFDKNYQQNNCLNGNLNFKNGNDLIINGQNDSLNLQQNSCDKINQNFQVDEIIEQFKNNDSKIFVDNQFTSNIQFDNQFLINDQNQQIDSSVIHGVMIGRAAYNDPWGCLSEADVIIYGEKQNACISRRQVITDYSKYADNMIGKFTTEKNIQQNRQYPSIRTLVIPVLNLFFGCKNSKLWKRLIDEKLYKKPTTVSEVVLDTLYVFDDEILDEPPGGNRDVIDAQIGGFELGELPEKIQILNQCEKLENLENKDGNFKRQKIQNSEQEEWIDVGGIFSTVDIVGN